MCKATCLFFFFFKSGESLEVEVSRGVEEKKRKKLRRRATLPFFVFSLTSLFFFIATEKAGPRDERRHASLLRVTAPRQWVRQALHSRKGSALGDEAGFRERRCE